MKKSNWIVIAIFAIASVLLLGIWFHLGLNHVDQPLDLILTIVWWVAIVGVCAGISIAEHRRRKRIRE